VLSENLPKATMMIRQQLGVGVPGGQQQPRRAFNIAKQKSNCPARQLAHAIIIL
jgi:hypothetical protein